MLGKLAVAGVLAGLALSGCGGDGDPGVEAAGGGAGRAGSGVLLAAADRTAEARSSRLAIEIVTGDGDGTGSRTFTGEGVIDYAARRGRIAMDLGELGGTDLVVEQLFDAGTVYVKMPRLTAMRPGLKPWLRIDAADAGRLGSVLGGAGATQQSDPGQILDFLRGVGGEVEEVGEDEVRGEPTTRYRATIDLEAAGASLDPEARAQLEEAVDALGTRELPAEVWVDGEGRLRRFEYAVDLGAVQVPEGSPPAAGTVRIRVELFDFGVDVDVEIPPDDQVSDAAELLGGLGAGVPGY